MRTNLTATSCNIYRSLETHSRTCLDAFLLGNGSIKHLLGFNLFPTFSKYSAYFNCFSFCLHRRERNTKANVGRTKPVRK